MFLHLNGYIGKKNMKLYDNILYSTIVIHDGVAFSSRIVILNQRGNTTFELSNTLSIYVTCKTKNKPCWRHEKDKFQRSSFSVK